MKYFILLLCLLYSSSVYSHLSEDDIRIINNFFTEKLKENNIEKSVKKSIEKEFKIVIHDLQNALEKKTDSINDQVDLLERKINLKLNRELEKIKFMIFKLGRLHNPKGMSFEHEYYKEQKKKEEKLLKWVKKYNKMDKKEKKKIMKRYEELSGVKIWTRKSKRNKTEKIK